MRQCGITSPEEFYFDQILEAHVSASTPLRVISVGSGACAMEVQLAQRLTTVGLKVRFHCIDFNSELLKHAALEAEKCGLGESFSFATQDCNRLSLLPDADVILVNQFFHHVERLESLCRALRECLEPAGRVVTSDIVGRNGHLLWPSIEEAVKRFWAELPADKRYDRYYGGVQREYRPVDHSEYSNEGVRAGDIVTCLLREFDFETFFTYGGSIMPFVERRIGFNFDPDNEADQKFIQRVDEEDDAALSRRDYPGSNMIASMRHKGKAEKQIYRPVSPEEHAALSACQARLLQ